MWFIGLFTKGGRDLIYPIQNMLNIYLLVVMMIKKRTGTGPQSVRLSNVYISHTLFLVTLGLLFCAFDVLWCLWCLRCVRVDVPFTAAGCCGTGVAAFSVTGVATVPFFDTSACRTLKNNNKKMRFT